MPETVPCNLCGSTQAALEEHRTRLARMPPPYAIQRCLSCGFEYLSPRPTRDELLDAYLRHPLFEPPALDARPRRRLFDARRFERLEALTQGPGTLLVLAALDGGWVMANARARGWDVVGVEFIPTLFGTDATRDVAMLHSPLWDLAAVEGRRFDAIHTLSLEHVPDVMGTLARFRELLRPGGVVIIEAPNQFDGLKEQLKSLLLRILGDRALSQYAEEPTPYYHLSFFTPRTLRDALTRAGFEIVEARTYIPWNPSYHTARRARLRIPREASYLVGGLIGRGPSVFVIGRRGNDPAAAA